MWARMHARMKTNKQTNKQTNKLISLPWHAYKTQNEFRTNTYNDRFDLTAGEATILPPRRTSLGWMGVACSCVPAFQKSCCHFLLLTSTNLYELISFILFHFCACLCACWDIELTRASINHSHNIRLEPCSSVWRIFGGLFSMSIGQYVCGPMSRTHFGPNYTMWYVAWLGELRHQAFFLFFFNIFLW